MRIYNTDEANQARIWNAYAEKGYLQSTIDPRDGKGLKCDYIDRWAHYYIKKFVLTGSKQNILEIGCGSGRNLFASAPRIQHGYGIDIALKQIENAEARRRRLRLEKLSFFTEPETFFKCNVDIHSLFTMWVLAGFSFDENLCSMLITYRTKLPMVERFVFFEQIAQKSYIVEENGQFYKKIRTYKDYLKIFSKVGLNIQEFKILNEKGAGPLYRRIYMSKLYGYWPRWLNLNAMLFFLDRYFVRREITDTFTDCVFVCERSV
jgi:SAM-dependent methyltransferase